VRLTAEIAASDCNQVKGTRKAKGIPGLSFVAVRSTCGDGYLDRGAPEGCDSGVGCAAIEQCDVGACTCTPLPTTTSTSATAPPSSSTTTTVPVPICGNGGVESGEPCDPFAEPSGCGRGQQCDLRDGRCTCAPIPDTVGTIVSFTPPPLPDPATLGLPASGAGTYLLTRAPGVELRLDPNLRDPVTAVARCARWITLCVSPPERTLDDCTRSAPHCATDEPWLESAECCPASCFAAYEVQRAAGVSPMLALERVLFDDGACVPGLRALLERD
jgi:hypothetical protein